MTTDATQKVIDRISKLRRLSESTNVHEASAAAGEAQRLMTENRISEAQLQAEAGEIDEPVTDVDVLAATGTKTPQSWLVNLASGIARANGCRVTITASSRRWRTNGKINMYGQPSRLDAATYLFHAMRNEVNRLADEFDAGDRAATLSFKLGAAYEICKRMLAEKEHAEATLKQSADLGAAKAGGALLVINRAVKAVDDTVDAVATGTRSTSGPSNYGAFSAGQSAGAGVSLGNRGRLGQAAKMLR